jgi:hypothetical protein
MLVFKYYCDFMQNNKIQIKNLDPKFNFSFERKDGKNLYLKVEGLNKEVVKYE